jgi:hypothetical protein
MLLPVQHSTAVIEMSLFPTALLCRTQCRRICRRITTASKQPRSRHGDSPVRSLSACLCQFVCLEPTSIHRAIVSVFLCLTPCASIICVTRSHFFFLLRIPEDHLWATSA